MRSSQKGKRFKLFPLILYVLFGALSSLTIAESAVPSGASGNQSWSLAKLVNALLTAILPPKELITANPSKLDVLSSAPSAKFGEETKRIFADDEAIIGTTKMYTYTLTYDTSSADIYNSNVEFKPLITPGDNSYTLTMSPSTKGGVIRIIPLLEGDYSFSLKDASGHEKHIDFRSEQRKAPIDIETNVDSFQIAIGQKKRFPFALAFGDMGDDFFKTGRDDLSLDRYLARYYSHEKTVFSSSDPSIFEVGEGGIVEGKANGNANLLFNGEIISNVEVNGAYVNEIASISLSASTNKLGVLDYDYFYGPELEVHYFDAMNNEIHPADPQLNFVSSDELIAKVSNGHLEVDKEGVYQVFPSGKVSGYRKKGNVSIKASLLDNPDINATFEMVSTDVLPTDVVFNASCNGKQIGDGFTAKVGDLINVSASFTPKNTNDKRIHVEADASSFKIMNQDTSSPSLQILKDGNLSFDVYSPTLGQGSKTSFSLKAEPRPVVPDSKMDDFHQIVRKGMGHFTLFAINGLFATLAFILTLFEDKKGGIAICFGISAGSGFVLAGLSELIQAIPVLKRGSTWTDVLIDFSGFLTAAILVCLIALLIKTIIWLVKKNKKA